MNSKDIRVYIDSARVQLRDCYGDVAKLVISRLRRKNVHFRVHEHENWKYAPLNVCGSFIVAEYVNEDDYGVDLSTNYQFASHYEEAHTSLNTHRRDKMHVAADVCKGGGGGISELPEQVILLENNKNLEADFARVLQETKNFFMEQVDIIVHELNTNYPIPKS